MNKKENDTIQTLGIWSWRKMRRISWAEKRTNDDVLKIMQENWLLIDTLKRRRCQMIGHTLGHGNELQSLTIKGMIEGTWLRGRPRIKYIIQIIKDAGVTSYKELRDMANDKETWIRQLLWRHLIKTNIRIEKKNYTFIWCKLNITNENTK